MNHTKSTSRTTETNYKYFKKIFEDHLPEDLHLYVEQSEFYVKSDTQGNIVINIVNNRPILINVLEEIDRLEKNLDYDVFPVRNGLPNQVFDKPIKISNCYDSQTIGFYFSYDLIRNFFDSNIWDDLKYEKKYFKQIILSFLLGELDLSIINANKLVETLLHSADGNTVKFCDFLTEGVGFCVIWKKCNAFKDSKVRFEEKFVDFFLIRNWLIPLHSPTSNGVDFDLHSQFPNKLVYNDNINKKIESYLPQIVSFLIDAIKCNNKFAKVLILFQVIELFLNLVFQDKIDDFVTAYSKGEFDRESESYVYLVREKLISFSDTTERLKKIFEFCPRLIPDVNKKCVEILSKLNINSSNSAAVNFYKIRNLIVHDQRVFYQASINVEKDFEELFRYAFDFITNLVQEYK